MVSAVRKRTDRPQVSLKPLEVRVRVDVPGLAQVRSDPAVGLPIDRSDDLRRNVASDQEDIGPVRRRGVQKLSEAPLGTVQVRDEEDPRDVGHLGGHGILRGKGRRLLPRSVLLTPESMAVPMFVDTIEESPILALIDQIFEMRRRGETVLGLHIGEPDFDTPPGIRQAAAQALEDGLTHYASAQGLPELREAIATRLRRRCAIDASASDVVVLPAKFAIYATLLVTAGVGDEVLLSNPTYLFDQPIRLVGARPTYFPLGADFRLDPSALENAITSRTRVLVLANPSNPTGQVFDRDEVAAVVAIAQKHRLTLVSDETYESLVYEGSHVAAHAVRGSLDGVVTIGSFSKVFAMTGWRVGYAVAAPPIRTRLVKVVEHTLTCLPPFIQKACAWGIEHSEPDAERFREVFRERRDHLLRSLGQVSELEVPRPRGAFYVFPRYAGPDSSVDFCRKLLAEERLALVPGVAFGSAGEHHVRISYSRPIPELEEGVERLARFLQRERR